MNICLVYLFPSLYFLYHCFRFLSLTQCIPEFYFKDQIGRHLYFNQYIKSICIYCFNNMLLSDFFCLYFLLTMNSLCIFYFLFSQIDNHHCILNFPLPVLKVYSLFLFFWWQSLHYPYKCIFF